MVASVQLQAASFRGAAFFVPDDSVDEGPNSIIHKYPDRRTQYVEDNGLNAPSYKVKALLTGRNALADFKRLRTALNTAGPGTLKHPWYGNRLCSVIGPYKVKRSDKEAGIIRLDITFQETTAGLFPLGLSFSPAALTGLVRQALPGLFQATLPALKQVRSDVSAGLFAGRLRDLSHRFSLLPGDEIAQAARALAVADDGRLASGLLSARLASLFLVPFESGLDAGILFDFLAGLDRVWGDWEDRASQIQPLTLDLADRQENLLRLAGTCRAACLMTLAEVAAVREYRTVERLDADRQTLLALQDRLFAGGGIGWLDDGLRGQLDEVFRQVMGILGDREMQLPRIGTLEIRELPASVLAYRLYDDDRRAGQLMDLNAGQNPVLFDGDVQVLRND